MPDTPTSTRHDTPGLPSADGGELDLLRAAVAADWLPRDAYERHWAGELVAAMSRQERLRRLEFKALTAAEAEEVPSEASLRRLLAFARYGARIDADIGRALRALRVLKSRLSEHLAEAPPRTSEPKRSVAVPTRTPEPEPWRDAADGGVAAVGGSAPMNRHERRRLDALARKAEPRAA